jgi:hypothetical protein
MTNDAIALEFTRQIDIVLESKTEDIVVYSQETIRKIELRIEAAYCRRYPQWFSGSVNSGVWESAAYRLLEVATNKPGLPIDPELYVAVQKTSSVYPDPWVELTQQGSLVRYRKNLRKIIAKLRTELTTEITRGECRMLRGVDLETVLETEGSRISPLSCYILAHRAGRFDLSIRHHTAALSQHRSCPLYRVASRSLLPSHAYPTTELATGSSSPGQEIIAFSRN